MKIAVFATGWNGEYLRDMYHGLENSQKEFEITFQNKLDNFLIEFKNEIKKLSDINN